jgi:hypothetical protein
MRQYRLLLSCLLAMSVLGCFISNSQADLGDCWLQQVVIRPGQTVVFPYITPGAGGKRLLCQMKYWKGCLCNAYYCHLAFSMDWSLVNAFCMGFPRH